MRFINTRPRCSSIGVQEFQMEVSFPRRGHEASKDDLFPRSAHEASKDYLFP